MSHTRYRSHPDVRRRGSSTVGVLVTVGLIGTLAATAAVVTPAYLGAGEVEPQPQTAREPEHQRVIDLLGALVGQSRAVVAVHPRGVSPSLDVVLWLEDAERPGRLDASEIAVLSHSEILQTVRLYALHSDDDAAGVDALARQLGLGEDDALPGLDTSDIARPSFCATWRTRPDVQARVIATAVSGMVIEPVQRGSDGRALLRISLTWTSETSDAPDEASVYADVLMRAEDGR